MTVPYAFANASVSLPLSQLDSNFNTPIIFGNTAVQLGNTVTTLNNLTLANVTISSIYTPITASQGGTGLAAPGTAGNVLTSTGSGWVSSASGGGGGSGTVTSVSVVSANGLAGTVANATTTPAITLSTSVTGLLKGNGTAISAAIANTDYQSPITLTTTGVSGAATLISNTLNIPQYASSGASAWVNFNGVTTASIRASFNVSSVTRNATGDYTVNFSSAFADSNYAAIATAIARGGSGSPSTNDSIGYGSASTNNAVGTYSTTSVQFYVQNSSGTAFDSSIVSVAIFR